MLVLSRKVSEAILIDDNIRITILRCGRGRVRISIDAPDCIRIEREEVRARRQELVDTVRQDKPLAEIRFSEGKGVDSV